MAIFGSKYSILIALFESHSWKSTKLKSTNPYSTIPLIEIQIQKYSCYLGLKVKMKRGRGLCVKPNISHSILIFVQYFCGVYTEIQKYRNTEIQMLSLCPSARFTSEWGRGRNQFQGCVWNPTFIILSIFLAKYWGGILRCTVVCGPAGP